MENVSQASKGLFAAKVRLLFNLTFHRWPKISPVCYEMPIRPANILIHVIFIKHLDNLHYTDYFQVVQLTIKYN